MGGGIMINSLTYNKILIRSRPNWKCLQTTDQLFLKCFVSDRIENIVEKGDNAGYKQFLLFPLCFQKVGLLKVRIVW